MINRFLSAVALIGYVVLAGCGGADGEEDYSTPVNNGSGANADALDYPKVTYTFTCPSRDTKSIPVSNGPCVSQQRAFARATSCNIIDGTSSGFGSVSVPFYGCLVNNSSGPYQSYYRQYLNYYGQ